VLLHHFLKLDGEKKDEEKKDDEPPPKGIPEFWLTIFKNVDMLQEMVQEHDEPVLTALTDVKVTFSDGSNQSSPMGFKLHFYFEPNEYFTNSELTKEYEMKCAPPEGDPFSFDGPEIYRCKGCAINWKQGKNLTVKTVKKKQKHKSKGNVRTITKQVKNDSFFNFFDPPPLPEDPEAEVDAETQELLTADFEIGHYIRERIIPRAVLFFTGEALEEDDYDEEADVADWQGMEKRIKNLEDAVSDLKKQIGETGDVEEMAEEVTEPSKNPKTITTKEVVEFSAEEELEKLKAENEKLKTELAESPADAPINTNKFSSERPTPTAQDFRRMTSQEKFLYNLIK
jgi:nucleosome assembly protein 1-like 1